MSDPAQPIKENEDGFQRVPQCLLDGLSGRIDALLADRAQVLELIPMLSDYSYKAAMMAQLAPDEGTRNAFQKFGAAFGKVVAVLASGEGGEPTESGA